ncbi:MAG: hypothetical protein J6Y55_06575 [Bacteroidales bacterium]|nr:hypothetical protein [Bacteroidales bacterium]
MEKVKEIFKMLLPILVAVLAVAIIRHYASGLISQIRERVKNKELDKRIDKSNLSYGESQYKVYAQKLFDAMNGWQTDEDAIYEVFKKMNNIDDILQLQIAFSDVEDENSTLSEWLHDDLSSSEMKQLNAIIAERSIEYSF